MKTIGHNGDVASRQILPLWPTEGAAAHALQGEALKLFSEGNFIYALVRPSIVF